MARSVVLLSGGLDSTVNLARASSETEVALVLYFDFGHKAAQREITAFRKIISHYKVKSRVISLPWLETITHTALCNPRKQIPKPTTYDSIDVADEENRFSKYTIDTWVPNRLALMLNIAASFADSLECDYIILGLNNTRGVTNPEHSLPFYTALNNLLENSTLNVPQVVSYTGPMTKTQIFEHGMELDAPLKLIWDCLMGESRMCGTCESCMRFLHAVKDSGHSKWFSDFNRIKLLAER
ncbi:MAG: 7-cyano-7-deazaguanine synthase [Planctomycetes bacterium]|nr:7-cyano-7-deazaguanine synthase [Planctomycetota bacterium]